jgi:SAM-dependent methyltransferase
LSESIAFDQAAEYYDRTRALPPDIHEAFVDVAASELRGRGTCIEIGVGTGRIGRSLAELDVDLVGLDLSEPMLRRLVVNAGGAQPFPLVRADATGLPFAPGSFNAAVACHVFHLIPPWRDAVAELVRVLRPGGVLVIAVGGPPSPLAAAVAKRFEDAVGRGPLRPGLRDVGDLDATLAPITQGRDLAAVPVVDPRSVRELIDGYERNQFGITWGLPDDERLRAVEATKSWAEATYGSLDHRGSEQIELVWRVYDLPQVAGNPPP